jgi:hypothetical protein
MMRGPAVSGLGLALLAERRFRNWGTTKGECDAVLPGDELIPDPGLDPISLLLTRRILLDIKARAERSTVGVSSYPEGGRR